MAKVTGSSVVADRITANCPVCSARLEAPESARGRILLCPTCHAEIAVPIRLEIGQLPVALPEVIDQRNEQLQPVLDASPEHHEKGPSNRLRIRVLTMRLGAVTLLATLMWGVNKYQHHRKILVGESALNCGDFDAVLVLQPDNVDALAGRIKKELELLKPRFEVVELDLLRLRQMAMDRSALNEVLPLMHLARAVLDSEAGKFDDAIEEMKKAKVHKSNRSTRLAVRLRLVNSLMIAAEAKIERKQYEAAADYCCKLLRFSDETAVFENASVRAWEILSQQPSTGADLDHAIATLVTLNDAKNAARSKQELPILHHRRSQVALSEGQLDLAIREFRLSTSGHQKRNDRLEFGIALAESVTMAFELDRLARNKSRAVEFVGALQRDSVPTEAILRIKVRIAVAILELPNSDTLDSDLRYALETIEQVREKESQRIPLEVLIHSACQALEIRCLSRLKQGSTEAGLSDYQAAIKLDPSRKSALATRLKFSVANPNLLPPAIIREELGFKTDEIWTLIPADAEAFSVIRSMQRFSNKIDQIAATLNSPPPELLKWAQLKSGIRNGHAFDRSGALIKMPVQPGEAGPHAGMLYLLPTNDFPGMIQPLRLRGKNGPVPPVLNVFPVTMDSVSGLAAMVGDFGLFAFSSTDHSLSKALHIERNIRTETAQFDKLDDDLDAYMVLTQQGIRNDLRGVEFLLSTPLLQVPRQVLQRAAEWFQWISSLINQEPIDAADSIRQIAFGVALQPHLGIAIRSRFWTNPDMDLESTMGQSPGGREQAFNLLPDLPVYMAIGGPVSVKQCELVGTLSARAHPAQKTLALDISAFQWALLAPESVQGNAGEEALQSSSIPFIIATRCRKANALNTTSPCKTRNAPSPPRQRPRTSPDPASLLQAHNTLLLRRSAGKLDCPQPLDGSRFFL